MLEAERAGAKALVVYMDSELVVRQMDGGRITRVGLRIRRE